MPGATLGNLPAWAPAIIDSTRVPPMGFVDDGRHPRVLPGTYALARERLWTAIDAKPKRAGVEPARLRYLRRDPRAAITIDSYSDDWTELAWVQVLGPVEIIEAERAPDAIESLAAKYEQYRDVSPAGPLLAVTPERFLSWRASDGLSGD